MRFTIEFEPGFVRVTASLKQPSLRAIRKGLSQIRCGVPRGSKVLLDIAEAGHLNASEVGALLEWAWEMRQTAADLVISSKNRAFRALLELVSAHRLVTIVDEPQEAIRLLVPHATIAPKRTVMTGAATAV